MVLETTLESPLHQSGDGGELKLGDEGVFILGIAEQTAHVPLFDEKEG